MKMTRLAYAGLPLPLLVGGAALAALSGGFTAPAPVAAPPPLRPAETAAMADMLDRLPVDYAAAEMAATSRRPPAR